MSEQAPMDRELNVRAIAGFGIGVFLILVASFVLMFALDRGLLVLRERQAPAAPPLADLAEPTVIPEPRLQNYPELEWTALRAQFEQDLASYRMLDSTSGRVQIPIEAAMQRLLEQQGTAAGEH